MFDQFVTNTQFRENLSKREETYVSEEFFNELMKRAQNKSALYGKVRTRTTTTDRIVQPAINTTTRREVSIPTTGAPAQASKVMWPKEIFQQTSQVVMEDTFSQIFVPLTFRVLSVEVPEDVLIKGDGYIYEYVLDAFSTELAKAIDDHIITDKRNSILHSNSKSHMFDRASEGIPTVSGHILINEITAETMKLPIFHLPQGYRERAVWLMNKNTAKVVAKIRDDEGNKIAKEISSEGLPRKVLNKSVIIVDSMPDIADRNIPIVLADLSRGYIVGRIQGGYMHITSDGFNGIAEIILKISGSVLQPAAFKALKFFNKITDDAEES